MEISSERINDKDSGLIPEFSCVGRQEARGFENMKVYRVLFKNQIGVLYLNKRSLSYFFKMRIAADLY